MVTALWSKKEKNSLALCCVLVKTTFFAGGDDVLSDLDQAWKQVTGRCEAGRMRGGRERAMGKKIYGSYQHSPQQKKQSRDESKKVERRGKTDRHRQTESEG